MQGDDYEFVDMDNDDISYFVRCEHLARYIYASEQFRKRRAKSAIDIACGNGYGSMEIARYVPHVIAVDQLSTNTPTNKNITYVKCDIDQGNFAQKITTQKVDAIACMETLEHVEDPSSFLQQLSGIIRKSGVLILSVPNGKMEKIDESGQPVNKYHKHSFSQDDIIQLLESNDFTILRRLYQPTSAQLYRNESRAIRDLQKTSEYAKSMTSHLSNLHYFSRIFAWPIEHQCVSYSMMYMCERN